MFIYIHRNLTDCEFSSEKCPGMRVFHAERDDARGLFPYRMWTQIYSDILHLKLNEDLECILGRGSTYKTTGRSRESYDALQIMLEVSRGALHWH